jgi:cytochrome c-type biogenesis protein CcmH/NrfF
MLTRHLPRFCFPFAMALVVVSLMSAHAQPANVASGDGKPSVEKEAQAIFRRVLSPYCPGLLLASCTSGAADVLRNEIRASLAQGIPPDAVEAALYRRFGDRIRAEPPMRGVGLLLWLVPLAALTGSGWWLVHTLRRWSPHEPSSSVARPDPRPTFETALKERLQAELDAL